MPENSMFVRTTHSSSQITVSVLWLLVWISTLPANDNSQIQMPLDQFEKRIQETAGQVEKTVVVVVNRIVPADEDLAKPFDKKAGLYPARVGMGVIIAGTNDQISILTCAHVVENLANDLDAGMTQSIEIYVGTEKLKNVSVHASDPRIDLAVLTADLPTAKDLSAVEFTEQHEILKGSMLVACGGPKNIVMSGQSNIASTICQAIGLRQTPNRSEDEEDQTLHDLGTLVQVELPPKLQYSGTPLFNLDGQLTAMVTSLAIASEGGQRITLAIPMTGNFVGKVLSLSNGFEVEYGFLGISPGTASPELLESLRPKIQHPTAAMINRISDNSPAEIAGLQARDLILRVDNRDVFSGDDLMCEIGLQSPGQPVDLFVYRKNGQGLHTVSVTLAKWPVPDDSRIVTSRPRYLPWRGLSIDFSTSRMRYLPSRFLTKFPQGVLVTEIEADSPAAASGLQVGQFIVMVDGQKVQTPIEFYDATRSNYDAIRNEQAPVRLTLSNGDVVWVDVPDNDSQEEMGD